MSLNTSLSHFTCILDHLYSSLSWFPLVIRKLLQLFNLSVEEALSRLLIFRTRAMVPKLTWVVFLSNLHPPLKWTNQRQPYLLPAHWKQKLYHMHKEWRERGGEREGEKDWEVSSVILSSGNGLENQVEKGIKWGLPGPGCSFVSCELQSQSYDWGTL